jgi:alkylation response protein AidB-like acyl-CoA dehydrogenase
MSEYNAPLKDMNFVIRDLAGLDRILQLPGFENIDEDVVDQIFEESGRFSREVLAPLNIPGDQAGCSVEDRKVVLPDGFAEAYQAFVEGGWQALASSPEYDGLGLPEAVAAAAMEMWQSANLSLSLCPLLTNGAIAAIEAHGSDELKQIYLPSMVSGAWTGTMNLSEPQAGSDLAAVKVKAVPDGDYYRISGTKIFITWGDQEFSENVIHLVLARLEGAPEGVRGISLFLVPKYLVNDDGSVGDRNDLYCASVEHKLGIHASPTCVINYGDGDGAIGYLVGEENRGLAGMFTMMNHARLNVGIQGLAISERAYQLASAYARERIQGEVPGVKGRVTIIHHPDVRRMLLVMKSLIEAMRATAYVTAAEVDVIHHSDDQEERAAAGARAALLTPIVKGWLTEVAQELTSLGVQVHGGMGFVEETGAAQHMRDARILTIYEGTTGIQANDLVGRKILYDEGKTMKELLQEMRSLDSELAAADELATIRSALSSGVDSLEAAIKQLIESAPGDQNAPGAASVNLLMLAGTVIGGWQMARAALAARKRLADGDADSAFLEAKIMTAIFYAAHILPRSSAYGQAAISDSEVIMAMPEESF